MRKPTAVGIDVSKDVRDVAVGRDDGEFEMAQFANDEAGHRRLIRWVTKRGRTVQVVLESTGTYSLDIALALHAAPRVAVMVATRAGCSSSPGR